MIPPCVCYFLQAKSLVEALGLNAIRKFIPTLSVQTIGIKLNVCAMRAFLMEDSAILIMDAVRKCQVATCDYNSRCAVSQQDRVHWQIGLAN